MADTTTTANAGGVLGWIERTGNRLPDPVFLFVYLIGFMIVVSVIATALGVSAEHPTQVNPDGSPVVLEAASLLSAENISRLWVEMPSTFTHFHPLGYVLVVMLGAGVAERSGLFGVAMRAAVSDAPKFLLTPVVAFVAMMGNLAADAAYVVLIPLAGALFAAAGRHPIAGIAAGFAGVSGGFSANLLPGQLDALLFGITEAAAETIEPAWDANIAGNWYFIVAMLFIYLPIIWFVTDVVIEKRLGGYKPSDETKEIIGEADEALTPEQKKGLAMAGLGVLAVVALWVFFTIGPGTPLIDETASPEARYSPLFRSLVAGFFMLFIVSAWAYGAAAGTIKSHRDVVKMMSEAMADMSYYLVIAFAAAHFVAMFNWSNLGLIIAVGGANVIETSNMPTPLLLCLLILFAAAINLFVGSASAKWAILAPVIVPMMMLLGISPEMTTAAYRAGDGATNIVTPLMFYFPLILVFAQRWQKEFGIGSLAATMVPYSLWMLLAGLVLTMAWVVIGLPLGPAAPIEYAIGG